MKQTSKEIVERGSIDRRASGERRSDAMHAAVGERRVVEQRDVGAAMVDALEDILQWERASERSMKVAPKSDPS